MDEWKKALKSSVLYIRRTGTEYQCKQCVMFIPEEERCWIHGDATVIKPYGTCGLFVKGKPQPNLKPMGSLSKLESGYTEESYVGYSCKRCEYFNPQAHDCQKVDKDSPGDDLHEIHPDACCNSWSAK